MDNFPIYALMHLLNVKLLLSRDKSWGVIIIRLTKGFEMKWNGMEWRHTQQVEGNERE